MIITHIVSSLDSNQGGPPNVVLNFAKFQKLYGHDVSIVSQFKKINYKNINNYDGVKLEKEIFYLKNTTYQT